MLPIRLLNLQAAVWMQVSCLPQPLEEVPDSIPGMRISRILARKSGHIHSQWSLVMGVSQVPASAGRFLGRILSIMGRITGRKQRQIVPTWQVSSPGPCRQPSFHFVPNSQWIGRKRTSHVNGEGRSIQMHGLLTLLGGESTSRHGQRRKRSQLCYRKCRCRFHKTISPSRSNSSRSSRSRRSRFKSPMHLLHPLHLLHPQHLSPSTVG
ncbi:hypothetical protein CLOM_g9988 [Closterium sp. NIES-68]|nr:hypothetical protein CLOM_g9988 [Closterium sp. NIES-68]